MPQHDVPLRITSFAMSDVTHDKKIPDTEKPAEIKSDIKIRGTRRRYGRCARCFYALSVKNNLQIASFALSEL